MADIPVLAGGHKSVQGEEYKVKEAVAEDLAMLQVFVDSVRACLGIISSAVVVNRMIVKGRCLNRLRPPTFYPDEPKRRLIICAVQ